MSSNPLPLSELRVDGVYRNTNNWQDAHDVFNRFFRFSDGKGINNTSGFRPKSKLNGATEITAAAFCVLVTNFGETEWPDAVDLENGTFTYYGDNRAPGRPVSETAVGGNRLLEKVFGLLHAGGRTEIPPFLCFQKFKSHEGTQMRFLGLATPGAQSVSGLDDLVAVWRINEGIRFQNYRAMFTILSADTVPHAWLEDLVQGVQPASSSHCPAAWRKWVESGMYSPLRCLKQRTARTRKQQMPKSEAESTVLNRLVAELSDREFEFFAAAIMPIVDERFIDLQVTRGVRDGGRDVLAKYRVGHESHEVLLEAYVEAKKWNTNSAVGVKPMMRLVSRLKHRDIGVFVTTSYFETQVQEELIEDEHPVLLISGGDIARILIAAQLAGPGLEAELSNFLSLVRQQSGPDASASSD